MAPADAFNAAFMQLATKINDPRAAGWFGNVFEEQSGKDMLKAARQLGAYTGALGDYTKRIPELSKAETESILKTAYEVGILSEQYDRLKMKIVADGGPTVIRVMGDIEKADVFSKIANSVDGLIGQMDALVKDVEYFTGLMSSLDAAVPEWLKKLWTLSNPLNAITAITKAPFNEIRKSRTIAEGLGAWFPAGTGPGSGRSTTVNNVNHFRVGRSGEITAKEAKSIRKAFDEVTRAP